MKNHPELEQRILKLDQRVARLEQRINPADSSMAFVIEAVAIIGEVVADHFRVPLLALRGCSREERVVTARHIAFYVARQITGVTCKEIGKLCNREHTSVLYALCRVREKASVDMKFADDLVKLELACRQRLGENNEN